MTKDCTICGELMCACTEHYAPEGAVRWGIELGVCDSCVYDIGDRIGMGKRVVVNEVILGAGIVDKTFSMDKNLECKALAREWHDAL